MNLRGGAAIIKAQLFTYLSEKGFFWTLAVGWMIGPLIYLLVWSTAAAGSAVGVYDKNAFVVYYLCLIVVNQLTYPTTHWSTAEAIENGSISSAILRPLPLIYGALGQDMGVKVICMPFVAVLVVLLGLLFGAQLSVTLLSLAAALAALLLAAVLRFLLAFIISLLAFWFQQSRALLTVNDTFIFLLAGQVAPIALFPGFFRGLAELLPYRYMVSFPVEVLMGTLKGSDLWRGFALQLLWLAVLYSIYRLVIKIGVKKYTAIGG
jgi:ABC-2 type transport system permease protein